MRKIFKAAKEKQHAANKRKSNLYHSGFLIRNCRHQKGGAPYYSSVERKDLSGQNPAEISFKLSSGIRAFSINEIKVCQETCTREMLIKFFSWKANDIRCKLISTGKNEVRP